MALMSVVLIVQGWRPFSRLYLSTCWSMAVLRNMASMMGAGPLMVMETDVLGAHSSNPP
jgi:hypothetical protein